MAFSEFRSAHPDGLVLSRDTGFDRTYGRNPYPGYEGSGSQFLFRGPTDDRLDPDARVVELTGPEDQDHPVAVPLERLRDERVVRLDVADAPVTVWWAPGAASAVDAGSVVEGRDVGQTGAFRPVAQGRQLAFMAGREPDRFVDEQTGSEWNIFGEAVAGPLRGAKLEPVARDDTFWFVWFSFRPTTTVAGG